jgi:Flp pilus assembly protein TadB
MSQTERREEPRNQNTNREKRGTKKPEYKQREERNQETRIQTERREEQRNKNTNSWFFSSLFVFWFLGSSLLSVCVLVSWFLSSLCLYSGFLVPLSSLFVFWFLGSSSLCLYSGFLVPLFSLFVFWFLG